MSTHEDSQLTQIKMELTNLTDYSTRKIEACSIYEGEVIPPPVSNKNFSHYNFEDFGAKGVEFSDCDFSYCVFDRVYFFEAKFTRCKFIGARFVDCNLRSTHITGCDFSYSSFKGTIIPYEEVVSNLPSWPNVRRDLMQSHRVNAASVGDDAAVKSYIREEMHASREYYRRAREAKETYVAGKYKWSNNKLNWIKVRFESLLLFVQRIGWGYGEYPSRLLMSTAVVLICAALGRTFWQVSWGEQTVANLLEAIRGNIQMTMAIFLGTPTMLQLSEMPRWSFLAFLLGLRYLTLSLFVSMLFRRISRR
jgi:hypothetical protein